MASLINNGSSGERRASLWSQFLQRREFSTEIRQAIKSQPKNYMDSKQNATNDIKFSVDECAKARAETISMASSIQGTILRGIESGKEVPRPTFLNNAVAGRTSENTAGSVAGGLHE